jgi:4'-phosphopantetheinyl transferase
MENIIHIFYIHASDKISDNLFEKFLIQIPYSFQQEIKNYKHWQSAQSSLLGKILLQYGFIQLHLKHTLSELKVSEKDRPFINDSIDFNISHSGEYIVCAITQQARVGIDIEMHRTLKQDIAKKYFNKNECIAIENASDKTTAFFNFWVIKESAIKCDGRGMEILSKTIIKNTEKTENNNNKIVACGEQEYYFNLLPIVEKYSSAICSNQPFRSIVSKVTLTDLE